MEIRLVIFLAFASVSVIGNTLLIWFAYKAFAGLTGRVTEVVTEFEKDSQTREWIDAMQAASERAVTLTEAVKKGIVSLDLTLNQAQGRYAMALARAESRMSHVETELTESAEKMRDTVARPAFTIMAFTAGIRNVVESIGLNKTDGASPDRG